MGLSLLAAACGSLMAAGVATAWPMAAPVDLPAFTTMGAAPDMPGPLSQRGTVEGWLLPLVVAAAAVGLLLGWARACWPEGLPGTLAAAVGWTARALSAGLGWVMYYAPIGTFALAAVAFGTASPSLARGFLTTVVAVTAGHAVLLLSLAALLAFGRRGAWRTIWAAREALVTALATGSSAASLPVEVRVAERLGVARGQAGLAIPIGVTFSKVGSTCYIAGLTVMGLALTGHSAWPWLPLVTALAALAGLFTPPISGGSFVMLGFLFAETGVPLALVPLFTSVPFMAKANTPLNALGRLVATLAVTRATRGRNTVASPTPVA
jgi:Na+/H+-dicarboxylate symporter